MADENNNMEIYNSHRNPPTEALKPIKGGRLNGMTDINPMWRIKALTEQFGACGIGWYYTTDEQRVEDCGTERVAIVNISLYVKVNNEWSKPIFGTGGSKLIAQERSGAFISDEAFKMATTDALSVACKQLGMGADIYWNTDRDKYTVDDAKTDERAKQAEKKPATKEEEIKANNEMKASVNPLLLPDGKGMTKERLDYLDSEIARTGLKRDALLGYAQVKDFKDMSEARYISLMNSLLNTFMGVKEKEALHKEMERTGVDESMVLETANVKRINQMNKETYEKIMAKLASMPTK